jgi:hypothetical protein
MRIMVYAPAPSTDTAQRIDALMQSSLAAEQPLEAAKKGVIASGSPRFCLVLSDTCGSSIASDCEFSIGVTVQPPSQPRALAKNLRVDGRARSIDFDLWFAPSHRSRIGLRGRSCD